MTQFFTTKLITMLRSHRNSKNIPLYALIFIHCTLSIFAQNSQRFEHISIEQGLSQSTIECILQDRQGFMWIGTQDGLNQFDGYHFTVFRRDPYDSNSLSDNYIRSLFEDHEGILWIGTSRGGSGGGLNRFDRETKQFTRFRHDPGDSNSLSNNYILSIYEDPIDYTMWFGTSRGLNKWDRQTKIFTRYLNDPHDPHSISDNYILRIFRDHSGIYWIATSGGLNRYDKDRDRFIRYVHDDNSSNSLSDDYVTYIIEDQKNNLWLGTFRGGLEKLDSTRQIFTHHRNEPRNPNSLSHDHVETVYEDPTGVLWLGTDGGGLNRFDPALNIWANYRYSIYDPYSLSNDRVWAMSGDKSGILWVGNYAGGINKMDRAREKFRVMKNDPNDPNSLNGNIVFAVCEDENETSRTLWIGTDDAGLNRYDLKKKKMIHYLHDPLDLRSISGNQVTVVFKDRTNTLWIATNKGLDQWNPTTSSFIHLQSQRGQFNKKGGNLILSMNETADGLLWFGTDGGGLYNYDRTKDVWRNFRNIPGDSISLSSNIVWSIYQDKSKNIWIGTEGGLNRYDPLHGQFNRNAHDPKQPQSLINNKVLAIYEDRLNNLWIATGGGLDRYKSNNQFEHFTEKNGLSNNCVYGILEDSRNNIWLSTNKGISKFEYVTKKFRNYDVSDGLQANEFSTGAYFKNQNEEFYFGCINGLVHFNPDSIKDNFSIPPIVITSFKKLNHEVPLSQRASAVNKIELDHDESVFSLEFVALNYTSSEKNEYAYKLEGFDEDWNYCGNRRYASYTNLDPGEYTFLVKGSNNDGIWNDKGASLRILVRPPYWQTWWFRFIAAVIILLLLWSVYNYRVNKLLEVERLRLKIAGDLHDDVGATLTKISMYSDLIESGIDPVNHAGLLKNISNMSREVITTMSDIVWSIDARNDTMQNMIDRMNDFAHSVLTNKQMDLVFKSHDLKDSWLSFEVRQNIYLIFKEAVNNIIRHSGASEVFIELKQQENTFRMTIRDNGCGINLTLHKAGHGLRNMRVRAQRIKGEINISNQAGTTIELTVQNII